MNKNNNNIIPIKSYINLYENKVQIYNDNRKKSGIYMFTNLINNKQYIGSSIALDSRFTVYLSLNGLKNRANKSSSIIYNALIKYNYANFKLDILEYCSLLEVNKREQYYLDLIQPEYNILKIANTTLGYKHLEETKFKISTKVKGQNNPFYGKEHSHETRIRISESLKMYYKNNIIINPLPKSNETRLKLSLRSKGVKFEILDKNQNLILDCPTIRSGAIYLNISNRTMARRLNKGYCNQYLYILKEEV